MSLFLTYELFCFKKTKIRSLNTLTGDIELFRAWNTSVLPSVDLHRSSLWFCGVTFVYQNMKHKYGLGGYFVLWLWITSRIYIFIILLDK